MTGGIARFNNFGEDRCGMLSPPTKEGRPNCIGERGSSFPYPAFSWRAAAFRSQCRAAARPLPWPNPRTIEQLHRSIPAPIRLHHLVPQGPARHRIRQRHPLILLAPPSRGRDIWASTSPILRLIGPLRDVKYKMSLRAPRQHAPDWWGRKTARIRSEMSFLKLRRAPRRSPSPIVNS